MKTKYFFLVTLCDTVQPMPPGWQLLLVHNFVVKLKILFCNLFPLNLLY